MRIDHDDLLFRLTRPMRLLRRSFRRLIRRARYPQMPATGWGQGWRVLVFRYGDQRREELHVLAPVKGDDFDWEVLRIHVEGEPWPEFEHESGKSTGVLGWVGHHIHVIAAGDPPQRLSSGRLVPGEFQGGVGRPLLLVDVRDAGF